MGEAQKQAMVQMLAVKAMLEAMVGMVDKAIIGVPNMSDEDARAWVEKMAAVAKSYDASQLAQSGGD